MFNTIIDAIKNEVLQLTKVKHENNTNNHNIIIIKTEHTHSHIDT